MCKTVSTIGIKESWPKFSTLVVDATFSSRNPERISPPLDFRPKSLKATIDSLPPKCKGRCTHATGHLGRCIHGEVEGEAPERECGRLVDFEIGPGHRLAGIW